jgi:SEC-C motif
MYPGGSPPKAGRNEPCPCGSGKKFKFCHGNPASAHAAQANPDASDLLRMRATAREKQRAKQQGLGKPIGSVSIGGRRHVTVGQKVFSSGNWKTFHDFLIAYLHSTFGKEWLQAESRKRPESRHPLLTSLDRATDAAKRASSGSTGPIARAMTGAEAFVLDLAYNLYLLDHNARVQTTLLERLKNRDQFYGSHYETMVAGILIRAGFTIDFENESDVTRTHCEFTAISRHSGRKFSVEAKRRMEGKEHLDVGRQLHSALKKEAFHDRIVFIEMNIGRLMGDGARDPLIADIVQVLDSKENITINGVPAPRAYLIITNNPYSHHPDASFARWAGVHGFKIPDLKITSKFSSVREMLGARDAHEEIYHLVTSIGEHGQIPSTFDGEIPEFAFGTSRPRLLIGHKYWIPGDDGEEIAAVLRFGSVIEAKKEAICAFDAGDDKTRLISFELTDQEIAAYRSHPDTFFGSYDERSGRQMKDAIDLYDWFFKCYSGATTEQLLANMSGYPNIEDLKKLPREDILKIFCESQVAGFLQQHAETPKL